MQLRTFSTTPSYYLTSTRLKESWDSRLPRYGGAGQHLLACVVDDDLLVFGANKYVRTVNHMEDIIWLIVYLAGTDVRMIQGSAPERKVNACGANSVYSGHDVDQDVFKLYNENADSTVGQKDGWRVLAPASRTNDCSTRFGPEDAFQLDRR